MKEIFAQCNACFVFPGGLQELVTFEERTAWIYRAWTLQEATTRATYCVFSWALGNCKVYGVTSGEIIGLEEHSAMMKVGALLQAVYKGYVPVQCGSKNGKVKAKIFGGNTDAVYVADGAKEEKD